MKKTICLALLLSCTFSVFSQDTRDENRNVTLKWAPTGLFLGSLSFQGEYGFGKKTSLTAKIGVPISKGYNATYDGNDADLSMKAISFLAGYRIYLSKQKLQGLYVEPYFQYVHHSTEGLGYGTLEGEQITMSITNEYSGAGVGAQLGAQFLIGNRFVIDLFFFGPQINSSQNHFKAVDISNHGGWSFTEAEEAEQKILDFLNQFPFIKDNTEVQVSPSTQTVTADFKGILPGIRLGVSIGVAL